MANRNETFGRLLKAGIGSISMCEGKTAPVIEDELGQQIGLAGTAVQRYKTGHLPPEPRTVAILAEACVTRGFLGREWLQRFLHAARYPFAEKLLDQLCPIGPERPRPPRVYENLPAPTYSQFVMRQQAFAEVADGLQQRSAVVLIVGMGGNGKTSLAREVAAHCLQEDTTVPQFSAVVWVSDKDRPGTTNLSIVLDEIARTLDYPGFTQFAHDEKQREVEQLLKRQKVLLVVDNFETITDGVLLAWLLRLPEPSKAIITTREYRRELRSSWPVELRGMTDAEAWDLITERARVLKIDQLVGEQHLIEPLVVATGGNPKAITMTLGLLKYERRSLQQVVDDLYAARGDLFDDLFTRAWSLLDEAARRMLLVMPFFPDNANSEALRVTADVQGFAFDRAVERLTDLALLDVQQDDLTTPPRYAVHSLVWAFTTARLAEEPEFERNARERWVAWYIKLVSQVGYCWSDLRRLDVLDSDANTIDAVIQWCFQNRWYADTVRLVTAFFFYYHVRGLWNKQPSIHLMAADAAHALANIPEEVRHLSLQVKYLSWQDNVVDAEPWLNRLAALEDATALPDDIFLLYHQSVALHYMARHDYQTARQMLQKSLTVGSSVPDKQSSNASKHWIATCLYREGQLEQAKEVLREALREAIPWNVQRATFAHPMRLITIDLDQNNLDDAEEELARVSPRVHEFQDRRYIALFQHLYARLHTLRGDIPAAHAALTEAIDLFERLGMRRELAEARQALTDLDTHDVVDTSG
jgi:LuxR family glucitol operon transcriptional activator